jgi:hypothetical protein
MKLTALSLVLLIFYLKSNSSKTSFMVTFLQTKNPRTRLLKCTGVLCEFQIFNFEDQPSNSNSKLSPPSAGVSVSAEADSDAAPGGAQPRSSYT